MDFKHDFTESADPVQGNLHGLHRADCDAQAAAAAFFRIKNNGHFGTFECKSTCGADPGAGPALETAIIISVNGGGNAFRLNIQAFEIGEALLDAFLMTPQLEYHYPFMLGENCCLEDIKFHVKLLDKLADDGLIHNVLGESQYIYPGIHVRYLFDFFVLCL